MKRPDRRTLAAVALAAVAAALTMAASRPPQTHETIVAAHDLAAGRPLQVSDVTTRNVVVPDGLLAGSQLSRIEGWSLLAPVDAGEPILASHLQPAARTARPQTMALRADRAHAVLGSLLQGDVVKVLVTTDDATEATLVASDLYVIASAVVDDGFGGESVELLVAVDDTIAAKLAGAVHRGVIDIIKVSP